MPPESQDVVQVPVAELVAEDEIDPKDVVSASQMFGSSNAMLRTNAPVTSAASAVASTV